MEILIDKISFKNTVVDKVHIKGDKKDVIDFFKEILIKENSYNNFEINPYTHTYNIPQKTPEYPKWENPFTYNNTRITCSNTKSI